MIIESELILSDLERAENMISKTSKLIKNGKKVYQKELNLLEKIYRDLEKGNTNVVDGKYVLEELNIIKKFGFLTLKPIMYVCNLDEEDLESGNMYSRSIDKLGYERNVSVVKTSAKLEAELSSITNKIEKKEFMESMNIKKSGLDKFISEGFKLLNLITFFTSGVKESRAWTIKKETLAPKAAGTIHTDFERGFIAADVINYEELVNAGGEKEAKNKGLLRTEGKDYIVKDGDVMLFRFNV